MRYWDTSALLPLLVEETSSPAMRQILKEDPVLLSWWGTPVECFSALWRRKREGAFSEDQFTVLKTRSEQLISAMDLVLPTPSLQARALRLLAVHPLRSADALQLAAALLWVEEKTHGASFVCLDKRLSIAARAEGFTVAPA